MSGVLYVVCIIVIAELNHIMSHNICIKVLEMSNDHARR